MVRAGTFWHFGPLGGRSLGARGEAAAARYLKRKGLRIVGRSVRAPLGEIDLVALDDGTVVFVEVKTRRSMRAGTPALAVDHRKQRRLGRLALHFCKQHGLLGCAVRFDVVAVIWRHRWRPPQIDHFRGAFDDPDPRSLF